MEKKYISTVTTRKAKPRSKRLREVGAGAVASSVVINGQSGQSVAQGNNHTHSNLRMLEQISTDEQGYEWLTQSHEIYDEQADTYEVISQTRKVKAGYADIAHDLTEDSPIRSLFLSRVADDVANGRITFAQGAALMGVSTVEQAMEFGRFAAGTSGAFMGMTPAGSAAEVDFIKVRKKAQFETLEIAEVKTIGGKLVVSPGDGVELTAVEDDGDGWICRYRVSETQPDGTERKIENKYQEGDQIYCKLTNARQGDNSLVNRYWWRLCTAVGEGWFRVSKGDCDTGSDSPQAGDRCAQLGSRTDLTRQSAIVLSTAELTASPLLALYGGIDSYSLEGKDCVTMGSDPQGVPMMNVYGQMYVGPRDGSSYLRYTPGEGVEVKARLSIESTVGSQTLAEYIAENSATDMESVQDIIDAVKDELQAQIDGAIETWYYEGEPTLANAPASGWTDDAEKDRHIGDLYYDKASGYAYRFLKEDDVYKWVRIADTDITAALAAAAEAQETADGKMTVFAAQPTPPYQIGDIWVNATYGTTYDNDILRCTTAKGKGGSFAISDWTLASRYTDDSALASFISGSYADDIAGITGQLDQKSETWYQSADPSAQWSDNATKELHLGDIWYNTTADENGNYHTYIYRKANGSYGWVEVNGVPKDVFDMADGKASIYVSQPSSYKKNDLWILERDYTLFNNVSYSSGTIVIALQDSDTWDASHWTKRDRYTDDTVANAAASAAQAAQEAADRIASWAEDGVISPVEMQQVEDEIRRIESDHTTIEAQCASYGIKATATLRSDYNTAYTAYHDDLTAITTAQPDDNGNVAIPQDMATHSAAYYQTRAAILTEIAAKAKAHVDAVDTKYAYLKEALADRTTIEGGLILTSTILLGKDNVDSDTQQVNAGINGIPNDGAVGGGIAAFYGGDMHDLAKYYTWNESTGWTRNNVAMPEGTRIAKGLDRFDGTGYRANGNLWWDADGKVHADPTSFFVGENTVGNSLAMFDFLPSASSEWGSITAAIPQKPLRHITVGEGLGESFSGVRIDYDADKGALHIHGNVYADGFVSALGSSSGGGSGSGEGSGGGMDESALADWMQQHISEYLPDHSGLATEQWVGDNYVEASLYNQNVQTTNQAISDINEAFSAINGNFSSIQSGFNQLVTDMSGLLPKSGGALDAAVVNGGSMAGGFLGFKDASEQANGTEDTKAKMLLHPDIGLVMHKDEDSWVAVTDDGFIPYNEAGGEPTMDLGRNGNRWRELHVKDIICNGVRVERKDYGFIRTAITEVDGRKRYRIHFGNDDHYIEYEEGRGFHFSHGLYSEGFVTAYGNDNGEGSAIDIPQVVDNGDGTITISVGGWSVTVWDTTADIPIENVDGLDERLTEDEGRIDEVEAGLGRVGADLMNKADKSGLPSYRTIRTSGKDYVRIATDFKANDAGQIRIHIRGNCDGEDIDTTIVAVRTPSESTTSAKWAGSTMSNAGYDIKTATIAAMKVNNGTIGASSGTTYVCLEINKINGFGNAKMLHVNVQYDTVDNQGNPTTVGITGSHVLAWDWSNTVGSDKSVLGSRRFPWAAELPKNLSDLDNDLINVDEEGNPLVKVDGQLVKPYGGDYKPSYTAAQVGARPNNWTPTATEVGVPTWAQATSKPTYTASEVGARPSDWMPTAAQVGARPNNWTPTATEVGVPTWAQATSKPTYTASEVGARPSSWTPTAADVGVTLSNGKITIGNSSITPITSHQSLSGYATQTWVTDKGYATQSWVTGKGYLTSHQSLAGYAKTSELSSYALKSAHDDLAADVALIKAGAGLSKPSGSTGYTNTTFVKKTGDTMSGTLTMGSNHIEGESGVTMLAYKPTSGSMTGVSNAQWGLGSTTCQGVIRSSDTDLIHYRKGTSAVNATILDSVNYDKHVAVIKHTPSANSSGATNIDRLKSLFDTAPKDSTFVAQLRHGTNAVGIGYFLSGDNYNTKDTAYGGFFVANYSRPSYIGIENGSWEESTLLTSSNYGTYALPLSGGTLSGLLTANGGLKVSGRVYGTGDDEGIVITQAANGWCTLALGSNTGRRSSITWNYSDTTKMPLWKYHDGTNPYDAYHPGKTGTLAVTSDLSAYLPLSGGTLTGSLSVSGNVGIGTTSPASKLHVNGTATADGFAIPNTNGSLTCKDSAGTAFAMVCYNGTNFWIGANETLGYHHAGATFISGGTQGKVYCCVPAAENYTGTNYEMLHAGNYTNWAVSLSTAQTITGKKQFNDTTLFYKYGSNHNAAAIIIDKNGSNYSGIGACDTTNTMRIGACDINGAWQDSPMQIWDYKGNVKAVALKSASIAIECQEDGVTTASMGGEINRYGGALSLQHRSGTGHVLMCNGDASYNVGIGTTSPSYKLHVAGTLYSSGNLTVGGALTVNGGINAHGRVYGSGDDEGVVIPWANNNFATVSLGSHNAERSVFTIKQGSAPYWRYNDGTDNYNLSHPAKTGTIAITSDLSSYLPLTGGTLSGNLTVNGAASLNQNVTIHDTLTVSTATNTSQRVGVAAGGLVATGQVSGATLKATDFISIDHSGKGDNVGDGWGLSLYNKTTSGCPTWGIFMGKSATYGGHGGVTTGGTYAMYFTIGGAYNTSPNRGWVFQNRAYPNGTSTKVQNVFSISGLGNMRVSGTAYIGGATTMDSNLQVNGRIDCDDEIWSTTGVKSSGYVTALSDERLKEGFTDACPDTADVAALPAVEFTWKKDGRRDMGSIAQAMVSVLPLCVHKDKDGWLSIDYGKAATMCAISVARKATEHERRIERLERQISKLQHELETLKTQ